MNFFFHESFKLRPALKGTLKAFNDFKKKEHLFLISKSIYIFWKFIQHTIYWDKTQMLKKNFFEQNKRYKNCSRFAFANSNLSQLYKLKYMVQLSKAVCEIFHFWFLLNVVFLFNKKHGLLDFET